MRETGLQIIPYIGYVWIYSRVLSSVRGEEGHGCREQDRRMNSKLPISDIKIESLGFKALKSLKMSSISSF